MLIVLSFLVVSVCALTEWEQLILDAHNRFRSQVQPPADKMYRLRWNDQIANNAKRWAQTCNPDWPHSQESQRTLAPFGVLGENMYYCAGSGCDPTFKNGIPKYDGQSWFDEGKDYDFYSKKCRDGEICSHYTTMTSWDSTDMGCFAAMCPNNGPYGWEGAWTWVVCQYGPRGQGYWSNKTPYEAGRGGLQDPPGSQPQPQPQPTQAPPKPTQAPQPTQAPPKPTQAPAPPTPSNGLGQWQQLILDAHNRFRSSVQPPAGNMRRMKWNNEIAANAQRWAQTCNPEWPHSEESRRKGISGFDVLGENMYYCAGSGCGTYFPDGTPQYDGQSWFDEGKDYDFNSKQCRPNEICSHYTTMTSADSTDLGCFAAKCPNNGPYGWNGPWVWIVCQYGPRGQGYWSDKTPYDAGRGGLIDGPNPQPTQAPPKPTQAPPQPTQAPPKPTQAPPQPTQAPPQPTQAPPKPTQAPPQPTQAPPRPTQEPPKPTQAPPRPTQEPPRPTQEPPRPTQNPPTPPKPTPKPLPTLPPPRPTQAPPQPTQAPPPPPPSGQLTKWEQLILNAHNRFRASVQPRPKVMQTLRWSSTIAENAKKWAQTCNPDWPHSPDSKRQNVGGFPVLGENMYYCAGVGCGETFEDGTPKYDGQSWFDEGQDYDFNNKRCRPGKMCSHYTTMTSFDTTDIGCFAAKCPNNGPYGWSGPWVWVVCQYGPRGRGYWSDQTPYDRALVDPTEKHSSMNRSDLFYAGLGAMVGVGMALVVLVAIRTVRRRQDSVVYHEL